MNALARTFAAKPAVRESVPLLVGLMGPSGSGKTFSALRLATGIQTVTGGDIFVIDTEARRALHYADNFKFRHIQFDAPFGSLDYLAAIEQCVKQGAKVIVVDSMTHEHSGPGGYLMTHEAEVDRMAGNDYAKRDRVKMAGWIKPSALRQQMITGILQLNANMLFCFRAKEKSKPKTGGGIVELGFMPIAGEELLFEMTVNCLLLPKSGGIPTWRSDQIGERMMMKLPEQFRDIFAKEQPLSEDIGVKLAAWAKGGSGDGAQSSDALAANDQLLDLARKLAADGAVSFNRWFKKLPFSEQCVVETIKDDLRRRMETAKAEPLATESQAQHSIEKDAAAKDPPPGHGAASDQGGAAGHEAPDGSPAAGNDATEPSSRSALSQADIQALRKYHESLVGALSEKALQKLSQNFVSANTVEEGTAVNRGIEAIYALHRQRITGKDANGDKADVSTADVDNEVRRLLA